MNDDRGMGDPGVSGGQGAARPGSDGVVGAEPDTPGTETITGPPGPAAAGTHGAAGPGAVGAAAPGGAGPAAGATAGARRSAATVRRRRRINWWVELIGLFVFALVIMLVIKTYVIQAFFIPSSSMEETLDIGDKVLVNKLIYHIRPIERGDIVVFNGSGSWDPPAPPQPSDPIIRWASEFGHAVVGLFGISPGVHDYVKRVIGLPGDHVACCNAQGDVTVNGVPLHEKSYLYPGNPPSMTRFNIRVPPGRLWVMGDHRNVSYDSRGHIGDPGGGTIPENQVVGRAFLILWPPSRFRVLPIPATFSQLNATSAALGALTSPAAPAAVAAAAAAPLMVAERRLRRRTGRRVGVRLRRRGRG
ncbi:MAG TPA: signal peptidase I [Streptosporangiaceae bacterium]|nr:signal peptidase I [Streptosporangiaceae bacterium]